MYKLFRFYGYERKITKKKSKALTFLPFIFRRTVFFAEENGELEKIL